MRLLRIGPPGDEWPALLDADGSLRDATPVATDDYGPSFWSSEARAQLVEAHRHGELPRIALDGRRIGAPIARPGKIVCIGLNYSDHAAESGMQAPSEPIVFFKAPHTVVGPQDDVLLPIGGDKTDWEVELGVVIGATARYLRDEAEAESVIAGYCVSNDVSERTFQLERGGQWVKGKSCETFNPLGPWLVTPDEVSPAELSMTLDVNGQRMQTGNTRNLIFSVPHLIWYLSQFMVLEPGDLINTGTPAGVGLGRTPTRYLHAGDVMQVAIDGLGSQRQVCRPASR